MTSPKGAGKTDVFSGKTTRLLKHNLLAIIYCQYFLSGLVHIFFNLANELLNFIIVKRSTYGNISKRTITFLFDHHYVLIFVLFS
jgi:hypothetical protein